MSRLEYHGDVKITTSQKKSYYRNNGHQNLFELFTRWLAGISTNANDLPKYIIIRDGEADDNVLSRKIDILTKEVSTFDGIPCTTLIAKIDDTDLYTKPNIGSDIYLFLYNNYDQQLASVEINSDIISELITGRQALVEWYLYITNPASTSMN